MELLSELRDALRGLTPVMDPFIVMDPLRDWLMDRCKDWFNKEVGAEFNAPVILLRRFYR